MKSPEELAKKEGKQRERERSGGVKNRLKRNFLAFP
jgi:hypothetical protein